MLAVLVVSLASAESCGGLAVRVAELEAKTAALDEEKAALAATLATTHEVLCGLGGAVAALPLVQSLCGRDLVEAESQVTA